MELVEKAAEAIESAEALVIGAGAGMGVDSGLPDFRGDQGFWRAYPPYEKLGLSFVTMANPDWFSRDPRLGWGFYGHRLNLYRTTVPHDGFRILKKWCKRLPLGYFVFTSNVDGQFQRAGFPSDRIVEVHGAIDWLQCTAECGVGIYECDPSDPQPVKVDEQTMRAVDPLPACPQCGAVARPNILMFGDWGWDGRRTGGQEELMNSWLREVRDARLVVVECGSGQAISTVRHFCEGVSSPSGTLIRINPREPEVPAGQIGIADGALETLQAIDKKLDEMC
ncbi:MAG: NAD-dependent protein deacetylase [Acidobacteria bacterium]|nr:NAD-dependent protein deacetylase [Acidobacteriota bacterium]